MAYHSAFRAKGQPMSMRKSTNRRHLLRSTAKLIGAAPGTLVPIPGALPAQVHVIAYDEAQLLEKDVTDLAELRHLAEHYAMLWVNVVGLGAALQELATVQAWLIVATRARS